MTLLHPIQTCGLIGASAELSHALEESSGVASAGGKDHHRSLQIPIPKFQSKLVAFLAVISINLLTGNIRVLLHFMVWGKFIKDFTTAECLQLRPGDY